MPEWLFWLVLLAIGIFLWWLAYFATKRMYKKKSEARLAGGGNSGDTTKQADKSLNMENS